MADIFEPHSGTWRFVKDRIEADLRAARMALEEPCGPDQTNELRGKIKALKKILMVEEPDQPING